MSPAVRVPKSTRAAARTFLLELWPAAAEDYADGVIKDVADLVESAFELYRLSWGPGWDIRGWMWPLNELRSGRGFAGNQPWAVLLREALALSQKQHHPELLPALHGRTA